MMVFFLSNMIENQCMSTGAFEITFNGKQRTFCLRESQCVACVRTDLRALRWESAG